MDENEKTMISNQELSKLKQQARFGKLMAFWSIFRPTFIMGAMAALMIFGIGFFLTFETSYGGLRADLCIGYFLPEGEYEGYRGDDYVTFTISKDNPRDRLKNYTIQMQVNGADTDYYQLYFKTGMMHLSQWPETRLRERGTNNVIVKNDDGTFSVLTTIDGLESINFWEKTIE